MILDIHRKASEYAMANPGEMAAMAVAKLGQKKEAIEISVPNVELTWKFGPTEIEQAKTYAEHMLALKQIRQLPDFATFFDTQFVATNWPSRPEQSTPRRTRSLPLTAAPAGARLRRRGRVARRACAIRLLGACCFRRGAGGLALRHHGRKFSLIPPPSDVAIELYDLAFGGIYDDAFSQTICTSTCWRR